MKLTAPLIACALLLVPADSAAQEPAPVETALEEQLVLLNSTMQEIVKLLEQQVAGQEASLLIKRVELGGRTLIAKKERLRKIKKEAAGLADEEESLGQLLEVFEQQLAETTESEEQMEMQLLSMTQRLTTVKRRRQELTRELMVLENDVAAEEEDMEILEAALDERLGLR